jgi:putative transposase
LRAEGFGHEEEAVFCGADRGYAQAGRSGCACGGADPEGGISEEIFYRWKKQYVGLESDQIPEMKQLQGENSRLKQSVAELSLDKTTLQDVLRKKW